MAASAHGVSGLYEVSSAIYYVSTPPAFRLKVVLFKTFPPKPRGHRVARLHCRWRLLLLVAYQIPCWSTGGCLCAGAHDRRLQGHESPSRLPTWRSQPQTPAEPGPPAVARGILFIRNAGWNGQLRLGASTRLAPDLQAPADPLGALVHAWDAPMPGTRAFLQEARVDPLTVVAYP
jgi:hypothetical protein